MDPDPKVAAELGPVEAKPQQIAVAEALRRAIALGRYGPGDRFPPERELAAIMGVGRMTLRAAIRQLNDEGFLITTRGRSGGSVVVGSRPRGESRQDLVDRYVQEMRENYEFRLAVEPLAASLSTERATSEERERIFALAKEKPKSLAHYRTLDSRFHLAIGESCGNRLLLDAMRRARAEFFIWADAFWMPSESLSQPSESLSRETEMTGLQHLAIAKAIVEGDAARAGRKTNEHLHWAFSSFLSRLAVGSEG